MWMEKMERSEKLNQLLQEERYRELTTRPIGGLLCKMAVPTIIGMLVTTIYSMTDTFWVSRLQDTVLTASVGIVFAFLSIIQAIGYLFGYGSGNYIARMLGKREKEKALQMAATAFLLSLSAGILIMLVGLFNIPRLVRLLGGGTSKALMTACEEYLRIILLAVPFSIGGTTLYNQLRLQGNAKDGMIGMMSGMLLNMVLDPVFILYFQMGVAGAGYATLCGQAISMGFLWILTYQHGNVEVNGRNIQFKKNYLYEVFAGGTPNFARQGISSVAAVLLNLAAGSFGESMIAAFTIAGRIGMVGFAVIIGFGQGFQPVCGYNYGAENYKRVKDAFHICVCFSTVFLILMSILLWIFSRGLMGCFTEQEDVIDAGVRILRSQCISVPFLGYYTIVGMLLQNIGRFFHATLVTVARQGIFFIPALLILFFLMGERGVIIAQPVADICAFLLTLPLGIKAMSTLKAQI